MMSQQVVGERTRLDHHDFVTSSVERAIDDWEVWHGCLKEARHPVDIAVRGAEMNPSYKAVLLVIRQIADNVVDKNGELDQS